MRTLTESEKRSIRRRIRYLCSKQNPEARSFRTRHRGYGPTGAIPQEAYRSKPGVVLFLGFPIEVERGGLHHVGDTITELFTEARSQHKATAELSEVRG